MARPDKTPPSHAWIRGRYYTAAFYLEIFIFIFIIIIITNYYHYYFIYQVPPNEVILGILLILWTTLLSLLSKFAITLNKGMQLSVTCFQKVYEEMIQEMIQEHACTAPISDNGTKPDCLIASHSWQVWFPGVSPEHSTGSRRCDQTNSIPRIFC